MASTADILKSAAAASAAGQTLDSNTVIPGSEVMSQATDQSEQEVRAENSTNDDMFPGSEDAPQDSPSTDKAVAKPESELKAKTSDVKEVITITDETGRRKKVEIDYTDRAAIRKAHEMMHGARKWQAERDQAIQSHKAVQTELGEVKGNWDRLEKAWQQGGKEGLVDLLEGRQGAYREEIKKEVDRAKWLENASPEEKEALASRESAQKQSRELERIRKENEDFKKSVQEEREAAEIRAVESTVHPVFDKYRFADKLGNPDDEHMFDEMLWNTSLKRLEAYEEKGLPITRELVEREMSSVAKSIRTRIGLQAEKKASRVVEQKKLEATENVQAKVKSGYRGNENAQEARDLINSGNLTGLLKNWGKYGSLFRK